MVIDSSNERGTGRADRVVSGQPDGFTMDPSRSFEYAITEKPLGSTRHLRVVMVGAGISGINMIRTLRLGLKDYELVVYDANEDVGGTWFENRYPGCRCDIPSHNYQYSWRPKKDWSNFFAPAEEFLEYIKQVCDEEDLRGSIKTLHKVVQAVWNEKNGTWDLKVQDLRSGSVFDDSADFLLDGSGTLNNWRWPDVPDIHAFQGKLIHTARWPKDFDCTDKVVAVIGNGSTGLQLVPAIQPAVKKLYHVVRSPTWVLPPRIQAWKIMGQAGPILSEIDMDDRENFSQQQIDKFKSDPAFYHRFVKAIEKEVNNVLPIILKDGPVQAFARQQVAQYMQAKLRGNADLCRALIPSFPLGCRRLTPAPGFLEAISEPNVAVVTDNIKRFVAEGIELESGEVLKVDAIICATGFDLSFRPRFPIIGRNGNLQDTWIKETPKAYMSCAVTGLPNYFTFFGPNGPIGHGSVFTLTEHIAKYITGVIQKCQTEGIKAIEPSKDAVDDYFEHISTFMPRTTWASEGRSWFKGGNLKGPVTVLHPGSRIHFFHMLEKFRGEDWEYTYDNPSQNRFQYLGNGFSMRELDPLSDSTWYLD